MPSLNVLFWNVYKKDLTTQIVNLALSKDIDILVLIENPIDSAQLVQALNRRLTGYHANHPLSQCEKVTVISRFPYSYIAPIYETSRLTVRKVQIPTCPQFLFTALHLVDKGNFSAESQSAEAYQVVRDLTEVEKRHQQDAMVVVGDFNMNPFEAGMISALGFHATMSDKLARKGSRNVQGRQYLYFYNPTWNLLGDLNKSVTGSYYYRRAEHVCYEWNLFDQVLIRPGMIDTFTKASLSILDSDGVTSLLNQEGQPDKKNYSDHLPLFFTLTF